ncbi:MAG: hypothetical protein C0459_11005 [Chitinophaga sp.]|jgi:Beta-lactamase enzyme family|nr:hypothetical protein [Chitinophaga sp.]
MQIFRTVCCCLLLASCAASRKASQIKNQTTFLEDLMKTKPEQFANILSNKDSLNVQVIYTQINRSKKNQPSFTDYTFNINKNNYFYPASTVKLPIALLALEKLNDLNMAGVNKYTTMITDSNADRQSAVLTHPTAQDSRPTVAHYIKQILLVSDNDAFNRLYEFLGQEYIEKKMKEKGYDDALIRHRLQIFLTPEQNARTNAVSFYDTSGKLLYQQPAQYNKNAVKTLNVKLGKGYMKNGSLVNEPFDFSLKNRLYLQDLKNVLQSALFPESVAANQRFNLTDDDRAFVKHWMSAYPSESNYPYYNKNDYWDAYCKFLLYGSEKNSVEPSVRIFNKVGDAYGFLIDAAYIIDTKNKVEFMLCAEISCNTDGIYNDDKYDYETIGLPFMKNLGRLVYEYELKRKRKTTPDLRDFIINYNNR